MTRFKAKSIGQPGLDVQPDAPTSDQLIASSNAHGERSSAAVADPRRVASSIRSEKDSPVPRSRSARAVATVGGKSRRSTRCTPDQTVGGGPYDLATVEKRLHDVAGLVSDWIWETDGALTLTYASSRVTEALGYHPSELTGCLLSDLAEDPGALRALFDGKRPAPPFRGEDILLKSRGGEARRFKISGLPVFCPGSQELVGYRGTAQDITEISAQETALQEAREAAAVANRIKSEFFANTSHELRTPLNAIIGFTEIMHSGRFGAIGNVRYQDYLGSVLQSAQHLLSMIDDMLDVAEAEAGAIELDEALTDPAEILRQALHLAGGQADRAGIALRQDIPRLPKILADGRKIQQVLLNLLSNAIKFTPEGGTVELSAHLAESGELVLRVIDSGIGIPGEDHEKVRTPFGQGNSLQRGMHQGTGLGLPFCDALVKLHGGCLHLKSVLGRGTVVTVTFPARRVVRDAGTAKGDRHCQA